MELLVLIIFSAGVFMNFLFAFITIPIIFAAGIPFEIPEIGQVVPGGPAWEAGLRPGDRILEVNGNTVYQFSDIQVNVALGDPEGNLLRIEREGKVFDVIVVPQKDEEKGINRIMITPPYEVAVRKGSPADQAGMRAGDRILTIDGMPLTEWPREEEAAVGEPLALTVERGDEGGKRVVPLTLTPETRVAEERALIGIQPRFNRVEGVRGRLEDVQGGLREGDQIEAVGGTRLFTRGDLEKALRSADGEVTVAFLRGGERREFTCDAALAGALRDDLAVVPNTETNSVALLPGGSLAGLADPAVHDGMRILSVNGKETGSFLDILEQVSEASSRTFALTVLPYGVDPGAAAPKTLTVEAKPQQYSFLGFDFRPALQVRQLNLLDAISAGFDSSIYLIKTTYLTLSRILTGDVAGKNLGGIITIGRATYSFAELGLAKLFFFLAILSINLGFLNVLPIPVLDGGHLLFLLIEKIKGSPVNERIMGYSQVVGLAFILALIVYVTYNDILRLFQ